MKYQEKMMLHHQLLGIRARFAIYMRTGSVLKIPPYFTNNSL